MNDHTAGKNIYDIQDRSFAFSVRIVNLCKALHKTPEVGHLITNQLLAAGTSVGANLEEARAGQSGPDFIHKNAIALKEARESRYWLRLIRATAELRSQEMKELTELSAEAEELAKIIGKIIVNTRA
jgi:four helix bundle protein